MSKQIWPRTAARPIVSSLGAIGIISLAALTALAGFVPPKSSMPGQRRAAGSRSASSGSVCFKPTDIKLSNSGNPIEKFALVMPDTNIGLTTAPRPTFFWYVPSNKGATGEFRLQETAPGPVSTGVTLGKTLYKHPITLDSTTDRLISLPLPDRIPPLTIGKRYRWSVSLRCNGPDEPSTVVHGYIERQGTTATDSDRVINRPPAPTSGLVLADRAARQGLWFDALTLTYNQRCRAPQARQTWNSLLDDIGYSSFKSINWSPACAATTTPTPVQPSPKPTVTPFPRRTPG